ncbi:MAG: glycosyltransferase [Bacteroidales bacterium]|nr:glycosyltransferase [Bacteroidales bacterium]
MSKEKKHILFLPRWYPNKYDSMWGLFVKKHAEAASLKNRISVLFLEALDEGICKTEIIEQNNDQLYTLYIYYPKPTNSLLYFFKFVQLFIFGLRKINKQRKIDIVHVHILSRMGFLAYLSKILFGIPYIITEHWSRYLPRVNGFNGRLRVKLSRFVVHRAQAVLPVTNNLKEAMIAHGLQNKNYQIIPNVVDDLFFEPKLADKTNSIKRVIHVSTFEDKSKNISGIIRGMKTLLANRNDFKLVFIGDGMDFHQMKKLAAELSIPNTNIEFTGLLEKETLVNEFICADFMIINSHYENMPVVINEAFACGLPVLSTNVGGISEHLNNSRGRLISPNMEAKLIEQFNWMLDHSHEFDSKAIREYAQAKFSYKGVAEILNKVYHQE